MCDLNKLSWIALFHILCAIASLWLLIVTTQFSQAAVSLFGFSWNIVFAIFNQRNKNEKEKK
jgi:hypothetical protein